MEYDYESIATQIFELLNFDNRPGDELYLNEQTGKVSSRPFPGDVQVWERSRTNMWIEYCEENGLLADEEWIDKDKAIRWIYSELIGDFENKIVEV